MLKKIISTLITGRNYFAIPDALDNTEPRPAYQILDVSADCKGRPRVLVKARNYRLLPSFGTWHGMEVHTKINRGLWEIHYEDFAV